MSTPTHTEPDSEDNILPVSPPPSDSLRSGDGHPSTPPPDADLPEEPTITGTRTRKSRTPSTRFDFRKDSIQELILLRALSVHRPFMAAHGSGAEAWAKVVEYLHETDRVERPAAPYFTNVKVRTCKLAWDRLSDEQKAYEAYLETATGIAPEETERRRLMEELYHLKQATNEAVVVAREERTRQQEQAVEERRLGEMLLESAESAETRRRVTSDSESSTVSTRY
ncbi:hypothetical protein BGZ92_006548, partial [Podila epicladia]